MTAAIGELRSRIRGDVIVEGDAAYDERRRVHNAIHDRRPDVIIRCTDAADVVAAVDHARTRHLDVAIRGGGHSVPGFGTCDGGLVVDLSPMANVRVDPTKRTAHVGGGATWGGFDHATHAYGLADTGRPHLNNRRRRADPRRRHRPPHPPLRTLDRQPAIGRRRHRRRSSRQSHRVRERRPVLGRSRRWRQLRGGHVVRIHAPPHLDRRRWSDVVRGRRRRNRDGVLP